MTGPMVQSEALAVAKSLGNDQFKVSTGWLDSCLTRGTILCRMESVGNLKMWTKYSESKPKLLELISLYEPKNIYNADKIGLFFGHYQQHHSQIREKSVLGQNVQRKTCSVIVSEYGERNGKVSCGWKSSKTKMFQEHEN
jgi:hypothetical protein